MQWLPDTCTNSKKAGHEVLWFYLCLDTCRVRQSIKITFSPATSDKLYMQGAIIKTANVECYERLQAFTLDMA